MGPSFPGNQGRRRPSNSAERGVVLILAIFAVALLLVLSVGLSTVVRTELLASRVSFERAQSQFLALAGLNEARAILLYEDPTFDTLADDWGPAAEQPLDQPVQLPAGYYRVRVEDACGRIDINVAGFATLVNLTQDPAVAQAIMDWRSTNGDASYYQGLPLPYAPRQGAFETPAELLLVKGVTPELYFGTAEKLGLVDMVTVASPSLNTTADGRQRAALSSIVAGLGAVEPSAVARWLSGILGGTLDMYLVGDIATKIMNGNSALQATGSTYTSLAQLATVAGLTDDEIVSIIDAVCLTPPGGRGDVTFGKVNVNTAIPEVLAALPGSSEGVAEALVKQREQEPFKSLSQVVSLMFSQGEGRHAFEQGMIDFVTTKSSCFIVEAMGYTEAGHGFCTLRALVYRENDRIPVLHRMEVDAPLPLPQEVAAPTVNSRRSLSAPS